MVEVLDRVDAAELTRASKAQIPEPAAAPNDWSRLVPWFLVGFAVAFSAWMLRSELVALPYPNDSVVHLGMVRFAEQRLRAGHNPFDAWFPYLGSGSPQFLQYQALSHVVTGALAIVFGDGTFRVTNYLLICTWPITVYTGARILGLDRTQAGFAALFSPMLSNITGYGFEWSSFLWLGYGMWSMLWAVWLLPVALGLAWRAIAYRERIALATFVVGLTCALHFLVGFFVLLACGMFTILRGSGFVMRLGRTAVVALGGLLTFAFVFVPMLANIRYATVDSFTAGTSWTDSFGLANLLGWLGRGEVFDYGRPPVISALVALGTVVAAVHARRNDASRIALALTVLGLWLYAGRRVAGPIVNLLPGGSALYLHRYVVAVHLGGLLLAGIGAAALVRFLRRALARVPLVGPSPLVVAAAVAAIAAVAFVPVLTDRQHVAYADAYAISRERVALSTDGGDLGALLDVVHEQGDGRVYSGMSNGWGLFVRLYDIPLHLLPVQHDADSLGLHLRTSSLSADVEPYFDDTDPHQYDLFNVKYVLLPSKQKVPVAGATRIAERGTYSLYEVPTSGYLEVIDTTAPVRADNANMAAVMRPYLESNALAEHRHPLVSFDGRPTPAPSVDTDAPSTAPPGLVRDSVADLDNGRFSGHVHANRAAWVMLKESYHPHWTATVDGRPVPTQMVAPSFVAVPVPAGDHVVAFQYRSTRSYPALLAIGALTLLVIGSAPSVSRRVRRRRAGAASKNASVRLQGLARTSSTVPVSSSSTSR